MGVCASIRERDQLCECVGTFRPAEESCVPALGDGDNGSGERGAAEGR